MAMGTNNHTIAPDSFVNELGVLGSEAVEAFLDNVVAIQILHQINNVILQRMDDCLSLLRGRDELNHLLQCAGSMLIQGNLDQLGRSIVDQSSALFVVGVF